MMPEFVKQHTSIYFDIKNEDLYLSRSLRPIWKFTHFTGILFDWCIPVDTYSKYSKVFNILRWFVIPISFTLIFLLFIYQSIQLVIAIRAMSSINEITMSIIWFSAIPITIQVKLFFLFRSEKCLNFFEKFRKMEDNLKTYLPSQHHRIKNDRRAIYGLLFSSVLLTMIGLAGATLLYPHSPRSYTSNHYLKSLFGSHFLVFVSLLTNFTVIFFVLMGEMIPTFVYYHSGIALFTISQELESNQRHFTSGNAILTIWSHYNQVRELTTKADQLFGYLVVTNIGFRFSLICTCAYSALYYVFQNNSNFSADYSRPVAIILSTNLVIFIVQLSTNVIFSSNLVRASENLKHVTGNMYQYYWKLMKPKTREVFRAFRSEQEKDLVACPFNLFNITPSLLLNMAGLVVTYVIVLLQAK